MIKHSILTAALVTGLALACSARTGTNVIDDNKLLTNLAVGLGDLVEAGGVPDSKALAKQLSRKTTKIKLPAPSVKKPENVYDRGIQSVVVISSVYKCDKCTKWHNGSGATGWILTSDGIMVSNYHVFKGKDVSGFGISTRDGRVAPIVEILAASERDDVVIFRVKGEGFTPLSLGLDARVGDSIHIIAHPDSRFYTYTSGNVSRYYKNRSRKRRGATSMAVTAEFARGSSGGPVMNALGNVVGMVASTQSIYYPSKDGKNPKENFQMVIRNCVPVSSIRALLEKTEK